VKHRMHGEMTVVDGCVELLIWHTETCSVVIGTPYMLIGSAVTGPPCMLTDEVYSSLVERRSNVSSSKG